ncbi:sialic acid-binding Ig-like lectin 15 isoform X1 [Mus musculus]|uniref:sialic acid-binding Ig-like lectin 15 isoform X1 n=1 Tax=Mus musculus TaxID=10090 RepID=UPI0001553992|nr:sialic acid-binding Ig-like lectin 15 isoform X1 [Mus musculus]|eukprot:XP_006526578.1 PREDICTED: sialic acid-binding Ig-like lectin 15 isoform X1 [Mus musculus]
MEGSLQLLACLACVLQMGSLVKTRRDASGDLLNTEAHSAPAQRWSMQVPAEVNAEAGDAAVLPCTFTHPHRHYDGPLTAIWRSGEPYAGPQVFRCTAAPGSELCQTALSLHGRFRLLGNPRRNDLSLRVERLALADSGRYFCRVEFTGDAHDRYESRHGVRLRVTAAPRIVNISVLPGPAHAFRALCTAEGEPPPALAWSGPAPGNSSAALQGQGHGYQVTAELPALTRDGRYTCTAANSLGRAEASVYLFRFHGAPGTSTLALLLGALGLKALLLLGILGARATRRRLDHLVPQDTPPRSQAQESNYENLSQMSPPGHQLPRVCCEELLSHHHLVIHHEK